MPVFIRTMTAASAALLLTLAVPLSASAASDPYPPAAPDSWRATVHACSVLTHNVPGGTFGNASPLQLAVTGTGAEPALATFTATQLTGALVSNSAGGAEIKLDFGAATRGVYDVTLVEQGTQNISYGVVTVTNTCAAAAADSAGAGPAVGSADPLAVTGTTIDFRVVWGAATAAGLGLLLWASSAFRSRRRRAR